MLPDERVRQIEIDATARADQLSDDSLHKEAVNVHVEYRNAPDGDERTELGIIDRVYTRELIRRGLTAK